MAQPAGSTCRPIFISEIATFKDGGPATVELHGVVVDVNGGFECDDDTTLVEAFERFHWRIKSKRPVVYTIDDGTGQISVFHFSKETTLTVQRTSDLEELRTTSKLKNMVARTISATKEEMGGFPIGTCLEFTGRLKTRRCDTVLMADTVKKFIRAADEVDRILLIQGCRNTNR